MNIKRLILMMFMNRKKVNHIDDKKINNILFVRNAKIGDAVCSFPLLRELNKNFPNAKIDVYASIYSDFLFKKIPYCNNIFIKFKKRNFINTFLQILLMRKNRYDLIVNAMPIKFGLDLSIWFMKPRYAIAIDDFKDDNKLKIKREDLNFYNNLKTRNINEHMSEYLSGLLKCLNIYNYSTKMEFPFDEIKYFRAQKFMLKVPGKNKIILNVDSSSKTRSLYEQQIVRLANALKEYSLIILSLPSRKEEMNTIVNNNNLINCYIPYTTESIFCAAEILRLGDLLISPDTSFIHIASGVNLPTIGIFTNNSENITLWGPLSDNSYIVKSSLSYENSLEDFAVEKIVNYVDRIFNIS